VGLNADRTFALALIRAAMSYNGISRQQMAEHVARVTGRRVSTETVSAWFRPSRPDRKPDDTCVIAMAQYAGVDRLAGVFTQNP